MIWKNTAIAAISTLALGCASQPEPDNTITISVGPDGGMTATSSSNRPEDQALAALLSGGLGQPVRVQLSDDEIWRRDQTGTITHIQSGATCPSEWAGFTRNRLEVFVRDGTNVGCNYVLGGTSALTFYVYEGLTVEEELKDALDAMKTRQPVASETPYHAQSMNGVYQARTLAYDTADRRAMRTSVLVGKAGNWVLKMRLTCPAADAQRLEQTVGIAFIGQAERLNNSQARPPAPI
jgi:hypothetical protein